MIAGLLIFQVMLHRKYVAKAQTELGPAALRR